MTALVSERARLAGHFGSQPKVANQYGYFSADGREFVITDPRPPRPWANVIANPRIGLAVSHTGSGFTWIDNSQLAVITRWVQDLGQDSSGKFLYLRDAGLGEAWSLTPAPVWARLDNYACRHGIGYTAFESEYAGIRARWTLFVDPADSVELWLVELENTTDRARRLELTSFLEWNCGVSPSPRREFHKLFIETAYDAARRAIFAWNHMWEVPSKRYGHWNVDFPYTSALAATEAVAAAEGDKTAFTGRYGDLKSPEALAKPTWRGRFGRHDDPIGALRSVIELRPGQSKTLGYVMAIDTSRAGVEGLLTKYANVPAIQASLERATKRWDKLLGAHRIATPESSLDYMINDWVRYQAISGRIWGRAGYYQQSGAYGFRDQLQDSQVWLTIDPAGTRSQINLHARHQFADGSVYHWWHPLSEQGHVTKMTDDLLWLGFVTANYIRETGDLGVLDDQQPYLDDAKPYTIADHVQRAFERVFRRTSPRGLPYIGAGDWNDGLSAVGLEEKGESVWLAHFLVGLLGDWAEIYRRTGNAARASAFDRRRTAMIDAINQHCWDGEWYFRATLDDGSKLGSKENARGRIYLNAQTWAILNDSAPADRMRQCWTATKQHLIDEVGALLLAPAYDKPVEEIGYITRYAPGLRENGGVYTHAATWAIAAAAKMKDHAVVASLLTAINPALKDPERYWAEPYVLPGNVDGPVSPYHGRGGWTWYTGSAQWLHRVVTQWVFGIRSEWDGLRVDPCLPPTWDRVQMTRPYRGATLEITIERKAAAGGAPCDTPCNTPPGATSVEVTLDGTRLAESFVPASRLTAGRHTLHVLC